VEELALINAPEDIMAGVDKILVIIVLIFSVVFIIASVGGFNKAQAKLNEKQTEIEGLRGRLAKVEKSLGEYEGENKELKGNVNTLVEENGGLKVRLGEREGKIKELDAQVEAKGEEIIRLRNMADGLQSDLQGVKESVAELANKFEEMTQENQDLKADKIRLRGVISEYENQTIPKLEQEKKALEERLAILITGTSKDGTTSPDGTKGPLPKINCTVLEVKRGQDGYTVVGLNRGSKDLLRKGVKLYVWNSTDGLKGGITIIEVEERTSIARVDWEDSGKQIRASDTATVQDF